MSSVKKTLMYYQVDMGSLKEIESALGMTRDKSKMVLRSAINETAKTLRKNLPKDIKKDYAYSEKGKLQSAVTVSQKATTGNLSAEVASKSKIGELYGFNTNPRRIAVPRGHRYAPPARYAAKVRRDSSRRTIALSRQRSGRDSYKAFVVQFQSGHISLAQRVPGSHMKKNPQKEAIKTLLSPSIPKMTEKMYTEYEERDVEDILMDNIRQQMQKFLG